LAEECVQAAWERLFGSAYRVCRCAVGVIDCDSSREPGHIAAAGTKLDDE
jgi:hypothetical protein